MPHQDTSPSRPSNKESDGRREIREQLGGNHPPLREITPVNGSSSRPPTLERKLHDLESKLASQTQKVKDSGVLPRQGQYEIYSYPFMIDDTSNMDNAINTLRNNQSILDDFITDIVTLQTTGHETTDIERIANELRISIFETPNDENAAVNIRAIATNALIADTSARVRGRTNTFLQQIGLAS